MDGEEYPELLVRTFFQEMIKKLLVESILFEDGFSIGQTVIGDLAILLIQVETVEDRRVVLVLREV